MGLQPWAMLLPGLPSTTRSVGKLVVESHECFAVGIETVYGCIDTVEGVVIAAFLVFRLVVDDRPVHFHLSRGEVTLEVLHVRSGIPQAPFGKGE